MEYSHELKQLLINENDKVKLITVFYEDASTFIGIIKSVDSKKLLLTKFINIKFTSTDHLVIFNRANKIIVELYSGDKIEFT